MRRTEIDRDIRVRVFNTNLKRGVARYWYRMNKRLVGLKSSWSPQAVNLLMHKVTLEDSRRYHAAYQCRQGQLY